MASLRDATIVILAKKHNPSIADKKWLAENGIIVGPFGQFIHHDAISMVEGQHVTLVLDEARLQLTLRNAAPENLALLSEAAARYVSVLPETPYHAIGFNFTYAVPTNNLMLGPIIQPADAELTDLFGATYELAGTATFTYEDFTVKVEFPAAPSRDGVVRASFNFHSAVDGSEAAAGRIERHPAAMEKAETVIEGLAPSD